ncbi:MAG TPA: S-layer homology domain-containing protein [Negativicutes bacterium]|nr:S-layer homology domain-containing protein [Negativicutes bacterium]
MRLTKREKLLLILLIFAGACYLVFQYIVAPQRVAIKELEEERTVWEQKKQQLESIDKSITKLGTELTSINDEINAVGGKYFSLLGEQEETILALNEILEIAEMKDKGITFEPLSSVAAGEESKGKGKDKGPKPAAGGQQPLVQNVRLSFSGDYKTFWNLVKGLWGFEKNIVLTDINIMATEEMAQGEKGALLSEVLEGDMGLRLYDMSGITKTSSNMIEWADSGSFRKLNPFEKNIDGAFPGVRYTLIRGENGVSQYTKFTDISGHWAEKAIDSFGSRHIIGGDPANRYLPDSSITRGELVMMLDKLFKWEAPPNPVDLTGFSDYSELGQSLSAMEKAFYKGYINKYLVGYTDGTLKPNSPITYEEFELVMQRVLTKPEFKWSEAAKALEAATGFKSPGASNAKGFMTRAEAVYYLDSINLKQ